jgi:hypothetical protein
VRLHLESVVRLSPCLAGLRPLFHVYLAAPLGLGPGRKPRQQSQMIQDTEAQQCLRSDAPASVEQALLLAYKSGRQQRRKCRQCGRQGVHCWVESQPEHWRVMTPTNAPPMVVYWLCDDCDGAVRRQEN